MTDRLSTLLPDNLKSRLARAYVKKNSFKKDSGENVDYQRFAVQIIVKGEPCELEFKLDRKDAMLLALADVIDKEKVTDPYEQ